MDSPLLNSQFERKLRWMNEIEISFIWNSTKINGTDNRKIKGIKNCD